MTSQSNTAASMNGRVPGSRGFTGRGGGRQAYVPTLPQWRGTSVQVCGLWPFASGAPAPLIGVPFGQCEKGGSLSPVCFDPISWFRAGMISNPSMFVLGLPGLGKSSAVRHISLGLAGFGVSTMVLGDLKPDYVDLVEAVGGQCITIGRGGVSLNPLDTGNTPAAASQLTGQARLDLLNSAHARQLTMLSSLVELVRGERITDRERTILDRALRVWDTHNPGSVPVIGDILTIVRAAPDDVRLAALDRGSIDRYLEVTEALEASLMALLGGRFGQIFAAPTTTPMRMDRSVVFDVSAVSGADEALQAAVLLACWSYGFGNITTANMLADAGIDTRRLFFVVMDELWRVLRAGEGMVDSVDALTRLNRQWAVGQAMITHTMSDLEALASEQARAKARGFVERAGVCLLGGLPEREMGLLRGAVRLNSAEEDVLTSWQDPGSLDPDTGRLSAPVGRGRFLIKVGRQPGIPAECVLTPCERDLSDTSWRWHE
ncbi:ATP/GTP-binding protein [Actinotignum sp. GS-2025c]|uniref:ATP/GTP-binding protein n=1 Tax=Actinotignum sp. GS-2025c TaxID=3427276 RepID=UPI003F45C3D5